MQVVRTHGNGGMAATVAQVAALSAGKALSPQQQRYQDVFKATCDKFGVSNPFDLEDEQTKARFFKEVQLEWAMEKGGAND